MKGFKAAGIKIWKFLKLLKLHDVIKGIKKHFQVVSNT